MVFGWFIVPLLWSIQVNTVLCCEVLSVLAPVPSLRVGAVGVGDVPAAVVLVAVVAALR